MTYRQQLEELRLRSLKIIAESLNSKDEYVRLMNALYVTNMMSDTALDSPMPLFTGEAGDDERGAEVFTNDKA